MYLIGVDLGTTGCKSIVFDYNGNIVGQSYIEYSIIKTGDCCIEQDADLWWQLVKKSISEAIKDSGVSSEDVKAIGISSQGISFVPLDSNGNTLCNAINWLDSRPVVQTCKIREIFGDKDIYCRTGKRISPNYTLPKLMWLKEEIPGIYEKTDKFFMGLEYITYRLTGKVVTDYSMASGTMAFNVSTRSWDKEILDACGLDIGTLPQTSYAGILVGEIDPAVAAEMGLHRNMKVVLGAQDQKCAAIGAGIKEGIATVSLGTATAISSISRKPIFDSKMRVPCFCLDEKRWILESVICTSGISLKWLKNTLFEHVTYGGMDRLAESAVPASNGLFFYPHMEGASTPYWRNDIRGFMYGFTLSTSREDIIRAFLEGIAFQIKINLDVQEEINSRQIDEIRIFGGGSNSELWCRIIADITGKAVSVLYTSEIANLGAAVLAGIGMGVYRDSEDALSRIELVKKRFKSEKSMHNRYCGIYEEYMEIQDKILK